MCRELTLIERMGVEYEEIDGVFYPLINGNGSSDFGDYTKTKDVGKYGHLWINFMEEAYPDRYRSLVRFGLLEEKALAVNEEAYELLCVMEEKLLKNLDVERTYAEKYALREQVRRIVEEIVLRTVVNIFH